MAVKNMLSASHANHKVNFDLYQVKIQDQPVSKPKQVVPLFSKESRKKSFHSSMFPSFELRTYLEHIIFSSNDYQRNEERIYHCLVLQRVKQNIQFSFSSGLCYTKIFFKVHFILTES